MSAARTEVSPRAPFGRPGATFRPKSSSTPDKTADDIARRVIWFRTFRRYSQATLARRAGVSRSAVNDAESGHAQITIRTLQLLAAALGTKPGVLLGCMDPPADLLREDARRRRF